MQSEIRVWNPYFLGVLEVKTLIWGGGHWKKDKLSIGNSFFSNWQKKLFKVPRSNDDMWHCFRPVRLSVCSFFFLSLQRSANLNDTLMVNLNSADFVLLNTTVQMVNLKNCWKYPNNVTVLLKNCINARVMGYAMKWNDNMWFSMGILV